MGRHACRDGVVFLCHPEGEESRFLARQADGTDRQGSLDKFLEAEKKVVLFLVGHETKGVEAKEDGKKTAGRGARGWSMEV